MSKKKPSKKKRVGGRGRRMVRASPASEGDKKRKPVKRPRGRWLTWLGRRKRGRPRKNEKKRISSA